MDEILISADLGNPRKSDLLKLFRSLSKSAKIVFMYRTSKTICGKAFIKKHAVFFKIKSLEKCNQEISNYEKIKGDYPLPELKYILKFKDKGVLIFKYEETVEKNSGLLLDYLRKDKIETNKLAGIFEIYVKLFQNTKAYHDTYPAENFFKDRINPRIKEIVMKDPRIVDILDYKLNINNEIFPDTTRNILNDVIEYFSKRRKEICFLSQGDPTTINIGDKPIFFDFETSGMNPIIAELSIFFWAVFIAESYYHPKYHPESFERRKIFIKEYSYNKPVIQYKVDKKEKTLEINLKYIPLYKKINMLQFYFNEFIEKSLFGKMEEINKLRYFLAMRILATFDISKYSEEDIMSSIAFLHIFCNSNCIDRNSHINKIFYKQK